MAIVNVSELEGAALNWAVANAVGKDAKVIQRKTSNEIEHYIGTECTKNMFNYKPYAPSTDWSQGGPLIEETGLTIIQQGAFWRADLVGVKPYYGEKPLIAACRAIVSSRFGDTVEVPNL